MSAEGIQTAAFPLQGVRAASIPAWLRYLAIAVIIAGVFLRFTGLDRKLYSYDEATTSIRVAGYLLGEHDRGAFDGSVRTNADYLKFQHVGPGRTAGDAVRSLAVEDPQHPPLYYLLERGVSDVFGNSVVARRVLSAIAGTLMLGAAFWLCIELFGSFEAGLLLAALLAVSPFFVIYSQQAREYTLWGLCTLVASAVLVRAVRCGRWTDWAWYGVAAAAGLYSDLIFLYVLVGHAAYAALVAARERRWTMFGAYALASIGAVVAFLPWLIAVVRGIRLLTNNDYLSTPLPLKLFAMKWIFNTGAVFFDLAYEKLAFAVLLLPIFALVAYAFVVLVRTTPVRTWGFVLTLTAATALAFILPDLMRHESRSTAARYLVPTWLALQLAVAYLLGHWLRAPRGDRRRIAAMAAFVGLAACGLASSVVDARGETSWAEGRSIAGLGPIARTINASPDPLVVYEKDPAFWEFAMLALSNELRPDVHVQLVAYGTSQMIAHHTGDTFVLDPTLRVREAIDRSGATLTPVYTDRDSSGAAVQQLRNETADIRKKYGVQLSGLSLWRLTTKAPRR